MVDVGSKLREYDIVAHLRNGGMAALYVGRRQGAAGFRKLVAIKVIFPHLAQDSSFVKMFVDEALISARIDHPNVVHVQELGEVDGTYFLVMEYVHATSLSQLLTEVVASGRRLRPEIAVHIAARVAEGLHAAHETRGDDGQLLGIVHRDVSPQNVLISARGHVKLIDFGIAKARGRMQQTTTSSLKGKIGYMSPEQAYGRTIDRRTDVYALGIVLWEMLTTRRAFVADDDFALLDLVREPNLEPPSTYNSDVPEAVDRAVMRALAPKPADRFQTMYEMRRALAQALPDALALDSADLSDLVRGFVGEALEEERMRLIEASRSVGAREETESAMELPPLEPASTQHAIEQMTVVHRGTEEGSLPELAGSPTELAPVPTATHPSSARGVTAPPPPPPSPAGFAPTMRPPSLNPAEKPPTKRPPPRAVPVEDSPKIDESPDAAFDTINESKPRNLFPSFPSPPPASLDTEAVARVSAPEKKKISPLVLGVGAATALLLISVALFKALSSPAAPTEGSPPVPNGDQVQMPSPPSDPLPPRPVPEVPALPDAAVAQVAPELPPAVLPDAATAQVIEAQPEEPRARDNAPDAGRRRRPPRPQTGDIPLVPFE